ncbi:hypothetical protein EDB81DRAFT_795961 [Dactylonectria macrodidyma]|uniref:Mitochondrial transcription factor 1 n=1 Tax=Dactylonectria macrodidyma TaxID=307937 RepID=A0A9P9ETD9_9HYPO|nr:hypothetical protein EDB81DRAFT_795961 [Dactylonectria macrodidyma]
MFARFRDARTALSRPLRTAAVCAHARSAGPSQIRLAANTAPRVTADMLKPYGPVAEDLDAIGLWKPLIRGRRRKGEVKGDKSRINITSQSLCDDIMTYLAPSLERHRGCDLIDINPGAGVWSRKLHEVVQPRKHIMMDKDAELYAPFLHDLLAKDNVEMVPKSGIVWTDLNNMLREHLTSQPDRSMDRIPERNDTLLVSVNLSFYPPKPFQNFECVSTMVLYQFMSSIRNSSLFQRYGLVRMLVWVNDAGKRKLLPRTIVRRKRSAFEAELSCEWLREVCGKDVEVEARTELRDEWINIESGFEVMRRMQEAGLTPPPGRETTTYKSLTAMPELAGKRLAGVERPHMSRPWRAELEQVEAEYAAWPTPDLLERLKKLRFRERYDTEDSTMYLELLQQREALFKLPRGTPEFREGCAAWIGRIQGLKKNAEKEFITLRDNYHIFRQQKPALLWDQRVYEPLAARADEFFPNVPCALLDFQPRAMHPLTRQPPRDTSHAGDMSDVMLRFWFGHSLQPASGAMDGIWPGFGDLYDTCPSLGDPAVGGSPLLDEGQVCARAINAHQWGEILEAFQNWPFRPSYTQLVGRLVIDDHDSDDIEDEAKASASGSVVSS